VLETKACTRRIARVATHPRVWYAYPAVLKRWSPWNGAKPEPCGEQLSAEACYGKRPSLSTRRHHLRIWRQPGLTTGETYGRAPLPMTLRSRKRAAERRSHRIDPHTDRDWVETDLLYIGSANAYADIDCLAAPREAANATGDQILSDSKMSVVELAIKPATNQKF